MLDTCWFTLKNLLTLVQTKKCYFVLDSIYLHRPMNPKLILWILFKINFFFSGKCKRYNIREQWVITIIRFICKRQHSLINNNVRHKPSEIFNTFATIWPSANTFYTGEWSLAVIWRLTCYILNRFKTITPWYTCQME